MYQTCSGLVLRSEFRPHGPSVRSSGGSSRCHTLVPGTQSGLVSQPISTDTVALSSDSKTLLDFLRHVMAGRHLYGGSKSTA